MSHRPDPKDANPDLKAIPAWRLATARHSLVGPSVWRHAGIAITFTCIILASIWMSPAPLSPKAPTTTIDIVTSLPSLTAPPSADLPPATPRGEAPPLPATTPSAPLPGLTLHHLALPARTHTGQSESRPATTPANNAPIQPSIPVSGARPYSMQPQAQTAEAPVCAEPVARYPASARVLHEEGRAIVQVTLLPGGHIERVAIAASSGFDDLDDTALAAARTLSCHYAGTGPRTIVLPVRFDHGA